MMGPQDDVISSLCCIIQLLEEGGGSKRGRGKGGGKGLRISIVNERTADTYYFTFKNSRSSPLLHSVPWVSMSEDDVSRILYLLQEFSQA